MGNNFYRLMRKGYLILILIITALFMTKISHAQTYKSAAGLTGGFVLGVTTKNFISRTGALELYFVTKYKGLVISSLLTNNWRIFPDQRFSILFGAGMHTGLYQSSSYQIHSSETVFKKLEAKFNNKDLIFNLGVDAVIGFEFNLNEYPFTAEIGFKPYYDVFAADSKVIDGFLAVRYIINRYNPYNSHFKVKGFK